MRLTATARSTTRTRSPEPFGSTTPRRFSEWGCLKVTSRRMETSGGSLVLRALLPSSKLVGCRLMLAGLIFRSTVSRALPLLLAALPFCAGAGEWFARAWRTDDGLPDGLISGIAQSPDGFLWVGTQGGLMRFDGGQFQEFSPVKLPDVASRVIRALTLDHAGRLWLAMDRGVVVCAAKDQARVLTRRDGLRE